MKKSREAAWGFCGDENPKRVKGGLVFVFTEGVQGVLGSHGVAVS